MDIFAEEYLFKFLKEHGDNRAKRELIAFWGRHPDSEFPRWAICYAVDCTRLSINKALRDEVEEGLVDLHIRNDATLYSLTLDDTIRRPVVQLAAIGWDRWERMLRRIDRDAARRNTLLSESRRCAPALA